jgi:hypothetical protein
MAWGVGGVGGVRGEGGPARDAQPYPLWSLGCTIEVHVRQTEAVRKLRETASPSGNHRRKSEE